MKNVLLSLCAGIFVSIFSLNVFAGGMYQPSYLPPLSYEVSPNHLMRYSGSGMVIDIRITEGLIIIHTNLGSTESPLIRDVAYAVRDNDMLNKKLIDSKVKYSYYHEANYDVITDIEK